MRVWTGKASGTLPLQQWCSWGCRENERKLGNDLDIGSGTSWGPAVRFSVQRCKAHSDLIHTRFGLQGDSPCQGWVGREGWFMAS